jgi:hypothetical protein
MHLLPLLQHWVLNVLKEMGLTFFLFQQHAAQMTETFVGGITQHVRKSSSAPILIQNGIERLAMLYGLSTATVGHSAGHLLFLLVPARKLLTVS